MYIKHLVQNLVQSRSSSAFFLLFPEKSSEMLSCNACNEVILSQEGSASTEKAERYFVLELARSLTILFSHFVGSENVSYAWPWSSFYPSFHLSLRNSLAIFSPVLKRDLLLVYPSPQRKMCFYLPSLCLYIKDVFKPRIFVYKI